MQSIEKKSLADGEPQQDLKIAMPSQGPALLHLTAGLQRVLGAGRSWCTGGGAGCGEAWYLFL